MAGDVRILQIFSHEVVGSAWYNGLASYIATHWSSINVRCSIAMYDDVSHPATYILRHFCKLKTLKLNIYWCENVASHNQFSKS